MAPPLTAEYHTVSPGAMREVTLNESMDGWLLQPLHGCIGRWSVDRWTLSNEETFLETYESMVDGQGATVDESLSESNRPSIAESNRPRTVTFSMLCMWGYQMACASNLKRKPTPV